MATRFQSNIIKFSFVGAPLLMLISDSRGWLFPDKFPWFGSILFWFSFCAYIAVIMGMVDLSDNTKTASIAAILATIGTLIGITIIGMGRTAEVMRMHEISPELIRTVLSEPILFFTSRTPGILFPIGLIMLTITMKKAGSLNTLNTLLLIIGIVLFPVGRIGSEVLFNVIGDALMLIVLSQVSMKMSNR